MVFHQELPANGQGILLEEFYSIKNCQLMDKESTSGIVFHQELPAHGQGIH
jgi:hypothetical protein